MNVSPSTTTASDPGQRMFDLIADLFPLCRSITGNGLRASLARIDEEIPLRLTEVPSGTRVYDWTVPPEWNIRGACIKNAQGRKLVDFADHNLHVVNYSVPICQPMLWSELKPHLHSLPDRPDAIPYKTSYYQRDWGFCIPHRLFEEMEQAGEQVYDVCIDSEIVPGSLTYGELVIPGESSQEVLISTHLCHPSLANDNLSSIGVAVEMARRLLKQTERRWSYRFLFSPATIGVLSWLHNNHGNLGRIRHGLILTLLGNDGPLNYKCSRCGNSPIDRVAEEIIGRQHPPGEVEPFSPLGYDERQYGSPGFDLPIGRLFRACYGQFPEYHTSDDNLDFISPANLVDSCELALQILNELERRVCPRARIQHGEVQLGKRGLFNRPNGEPMPAIERKAIAWVLNLADGRHTWDEIAERSGLPRSAIDFAARRLLASELLE